LFCLPLESNKNYDQGNVTYQAVHNYQTMGT
jgi:hypothetical protein